MFDRVGAHGWRDSGHFTFSVVSGALRRWIAQRLPKTPRKVLSIGCGSGELEQRLAEAGHHVVGVDVSLAILKSARRRGMAAAVLGDALLLPFPPGYFDRVLICETIGYLDLAAAFREANRVLKKRGRLIITTYAPNVPTHIRYKRYGYEDIVPPLTGAGFGVAEHRFLRVTRQAVTPVPSPGASKVLFVEARKHANS